MKQPEYHDARIVFDLSRGLIECLRWLSDAVRDDAGASRAIEVLSVFGKSISLLESALTNPGYVWNTSRPTAVTGFRLAHNVPVSVLLTARRIRCVLMVALQDQTDVSFDPEVASRDELESAANRRWEIVCRLLMPHLSEIDVVLAGVALEIEFIAAQNSPQNVSGIKLPPILEDELAAYESLPDGWATMSQGQQLDALTNADQPDSVSPVDVGSPVVEKSNGNEQPDAPESLALPAKIKLPSDDAMKCFRMYLATGWKQERLAKRMSEELNRPIKQWHVSRWLKAVKESGAAKDVWPEFPSTSRAQPIAMDPKTLELDRRKDGLTPRQRNKKSEDSDD